MPGSGVLNPALAHSGSRPGSGFGQPAARGVVVALVVTEHEHRPLLRGQRAERPAQFVA